MSADVEQSDARRHWTQVCVTVLQIGVGNGQSGLERHAIPPSPRVPPVPPEVDVAPGGSRWMASVHAARPAAPARPRRT